MSEFLALDWDDQQCVGVAARLAPPNAQLRQWVRFEWAAEERPSENPQAAGKRLRAELDRAGVETLPVLLSLPREEAVVRLLEFPECTDEELPDLVRLQAATRSSVPLDRLLLDYLPLPPLADVAGRRVLLVTLGKPSADRVQTVLSAGGLEAAKLQISSVGAAELIAHQAAPQSGDAGSAILAVNCIGARIEITAIWRQQIVLMHAASISTHDPPDAQVASILGETSRATVALSQAAPGIRLDSGWLIGTPPELAGLAKGLGQRFGFDFQLLDSPFRSPGVRADFDPSAAHAQAAAAPVGLLLAEAKPLVNSIDFLHPRRKIEKPDRRRLKLGIAGAAAALVIVGTFVGIRYRIGQLDAEIAKRQKDLADGNARLKSLAPLLDKATTLDEWSRRDIDWIGQFRKIKEAMQAGDKLHLTSFEGHVASFATTSQDLATISAKGRAKTRDDVEELEDRLEDLGYRVNPREIAEDPADRDFPEKVDLSLVITPGTSKEAKPADSKPAAPAAPIARQAEKPAETKTK